MGRAIHGSRGPGQVYCVAAGGVRYQNVRIEAVLFNYEAPAGAAPCAADNVWAVRVLASEYPRIVAFVTAHPAAQLPVTPTTVRVYEPYTARGYIKRGLTLGRVVTGTCTSASYVTGRADAYRCLAGSNIMDPCFRPPAHDNGFVVCVSDPWSTTYTLLHRTGALPPHGRKATPPGQGQPWAIETTAGERCGFVGGATLSVGDLRLNYGCAPDGEASVYGDVDRSGKQWTVLLWRGSEGTVPKRSQLVRVGVSVAWF